MENRPLSVVTLLIVWIGMVAPVWAEGGPSPEQMADWDRRLEKANALQGQAKSQFDAANQFFVGKEKACYEKFRVNACIDEARREHGRLTTEARRVQNEGKALERQVRKEKLSDKDGRFIAETDLRAADLQAREAETSAARAQVMENEAALRSDKEKQAAEGVRRHAADADRLQKKRAEHEARVARQIEKSERRSAEDAAK